MTILGAVYDVGQPRESWLSGVLRTVASTLDPGAGVAGVLYEIFGGDGLRTDVMEGINIPEGWQEAGEAMHQDARFVPHIIASYRSILCAKLSEQVPDPSMLGSIRRDYYERHAMGEQISINGIDCSGKGCALYLFSRGTLTLSETERDLFSRLATHLATAYRLQRQLADAQSSSVGVEAVLTPSGQVDHAEAQAQSVEAQADLKSAVRKRESARACAAADAERGVRSLKGLVSARWTLVDHYESGGKRYVLARENAPKPLGLPRLSDREQQVVALAALGRSNKLIAYELGLAYSTVRVLMARACVKVGATNRSELVSRQRSVPLR